MSTASTTPDSVVKAEIRGAAGRRVRCLTLQERERLSARISRHILRSDAYKMADQVVAYLALSDEVVLDTLLESAVRDGRRILLPVMKDGVDLDFRSWLPGQPLRRASFGGREPDTGEPALPVRSVSLVPGRAFDVRGGRLGRGKGYYDRRMDWLTTLGPTIGVAFDCQMVASVPQEPHDRRVQFVATEIGIIDASGTGAETVRGTPETSGGIDVDGETR